MPLKLNFLHIKPFYSWIGIALLLTGFTLLAAVYLQYATTTEQLSEVENELAKLNYKKPVKNTKNSTTLTDELKRQLALQTQIQHSLATPWPALLQALKETKTDTIQLTEINPNATTHTLSITGRAPQLDDVLGYVKALSQQSALSNVDLIDHQVIKTDANNMVKFEIEAIWNQP